MIGHGTQFEIETGTPGTYTAIDGVLSVDFGSNKVDALDNTDMGVVGSKRTYEGGLENSGDVTIKINVKPGNASQTFLFTSKDGAAHNMKVIYPGNVRTKSFSGIILSIDESIPDDKLPTYTAK